MMQQRSTNIDLVAQEQVWMLLEDSRKHNKIGTDTKPRERHTCRNTADPISLTSGVASKTFTDSPLAFMAIANAKPAGPPPTIAQSRTFSWTRDASGAETAEEGIVPRADLQVVHLSRCLGVPKRWEVALLPRDIHGTGEKEQWLNPCSDEPRDCVTCDERVTNAQTQWNQVITK